jgi:hypothetical protein
VAQRCRAGAHKLIPEQLLLALALVLRGEVGRQRDERVVRPHPLE